MGELKRSRKNERLGETRMMKCGLNCTIIDYIRSGRIIVKFENGLEKSGSYSKFLAGTLTTKKSINNTTNESRIGLRNVMNCGEECEIIESINSSHIYVKFLKSGLVKHATYKAFKFGLIENKNKNKPDEMKNVEYFNPTCGLKYKIVGKSKNKAKCFTVEFEDGVQKDTAYNQVYKCRALHPCFSKMGTMQNFLGYSGKRVKVGKRYYWNIPEYGLITPQKLLSEL